MAKRPTLTTVSSGYSNAATINADLQALRDGFSNTLSLDGSTPNSMGADLDLNSNDILNVGIVNAATVKINGVAVSPTASFTSDRTDIKYEFATVAQLLAFDNDGYFTTGDYILAGGFMYKVVSSGEHVTTLGGDKLTVVPMANGRRAMAAFGSDAAAMAVAIATGPIEVADDITIASSVSVSGVVDILSSNGATINFTGTSDILFDLSAPLTLFKVHGCTITGASTSKLIDITENIDVFEMADNTISGFAEIVETSDATADVERIVLHNNVVSGCGNGFDFLSNSIGQATVTKNHFNDMAGTGRLCCVTLGNNDYTTRQDRGNYIITDNQFHNIVSSNATAETHAILVYGWHGVIANNIVNTLNNAGTSGAEAIYGKLRSGQIIGNNVHDGGYSGNGGISVKGNVRSESDAPDGYTVTVAANIVTFSTHSGATATGIYIQNEQVICADNHIENASNGDILIFPTSGAKDIKVTGNILYGSTSRFPISCQTDVTGLTIKDNNIREWKGQPSATGQAIRVEYGSALATTDISVCGNIITAGSGSTATYLEGITFDTESGGGSLVNIVCNDNIIRTTASANGRGIELIGTGTVAGLTMIGNRVDADANIFNIGSGVTLSGTVHISDNKFGGPTIVTSGGAGNLSLIDMNQPYVWKQSAAASFTLPTAKPGLKFTVIKGSTSANAVGFDCGGSDVFRGSLTVASIAVQGGITAQCFETGIWDIVSAAGTVTFS